MICEIEKKHEKLDFPRKFGHKMEKFKDYQFMGFLKREN